MSADTCNAGRMAEEYRAPLFGVEVTLTELELLIQHRAWLRQQLLESDSPDAAQAVADAMRRLAGSAPSRPVTKSIARTGKRQAHEPVHGVTDAQLE